MRKSGYGFEKIADDAGESFVGQYRKTGCGHIYILLSETDVICVFLYKDVKVGHKKTNRLHCFLLKLAL